MATASENIETAITNCSAKIAEAMADPKPSYSVDGQSVAWTEYYRMLTTQMTDLIALRQSLDAPFQLITKNLTY